MPGPVSDQYNGPSDDTPYVPSWYAPSSKETRPMNFGDAIAALKKGERVQRAGWNGKGMHLYLEDWLEGVMTFGADNRKYQPVIVMFTAAKEHQPGWLASQADMLAEDWTIVDG
jgi:hypothetical protein